MSKPIKGQVVDTSEAYEVLSNALIKNTKTVKDLPKPAKVSIVKQLKNAEYSLRKIQAITGLDKGTVQRYINLSIEDKYTQFTDAIDKILLEKRKQVAFMSANALTDKLSDAKGERLKDVIQAYKVSGEAVSGISSQTNQTAQVVTINLHPALTRDKPPKQ